MDQRTEVDDKRIELTTVQIKKTTHRRLKAYCSSQNPKISLPDVANNAINEFLDRAKFTEKGKRGKATREGAI